MRPRDPGKVKEWASSFGGKAAAALVELMTAEEIGKVAEALTGHAKELKAATEGAAQASAALKAADDRLVRAKVEPEIVVAVRARLMSAVNAMNGVQAAGGAQ